MGQFYCPFLYLPNTESKLNFMKKFQVSFFLITFFILGCQQQQNDYAQLNGYTMGTSYQITLRKNNLDTDALKANIDSRLEQINQLMSTYIDDSELSIFNHSISTDCQPLSAETLYVINNAIDVSIQTKGKFDVTLAPLIEIWGFDKKNTHNNIPEQVLINELLTQIGYQKIKLGEKCVSKESPALSINLSAIAKGYAVDEIAQLISDAGAENYLVEIGGEIASKGVNKKSQPWRLAIESASTEKRSIQKILTPNGLGVATSGDYRNYFEKDGKRFSHTIDPTTGYPITHQLASVTVLHEKTMIADALATAMMVMGPTESLNFANKNNIPIFMLVKKDGEFTEIFSHAFTAFIE